MTKRKTQAPKTPTTTPSEISDDMAKQLDATFDAMASQLHHLHAVLHGVRSDLNLRRMQAADTWNAYKHIRPHVPTPAPWVDEHVDELNVVYRRGTSWAEAFRRKCIADGRYYYSVSDVRISDDAKIVSASEEDGGVWLQALVWVDCSLDTDEV